MEHDKSMVNEFNKKLYNDMHQLYNSSIRFLIN